MRCRDSTSGALEGGNRTFTNKVGALSTTELEAPNETMELHHNAMWLQGDLNRLGCSNTQEEQNPHQKVLGNQISFGGSVDLGLLLQSLANHQV